MSSNVAVIGLATMVTLSLIARKRNYLTTSVSLMVMSGALATWLFGIFFVFG